MDGALHSSLSGGNVLAPLPVESASSSHPLVRLRASRPPADRAAVPPWHHLPGSRPARTLAWPLVRRRRSALASTTPILPPAKDTNGCAAACLRRAELATTDPISPPPKTTAPGSAACRRRAALASGDDSRLTAFQPHDSRRRSALAATAPVH